MKVVDKGSETFVILDDDEIFTVQEMRVKRYWIEGANQGDDIAKVIQIRKDNSG